MRTLTRALAFAVLLLAAPAGLRAQEPVALCDSLAGEAVPLADIDAETALAACGAALAEQPAEPRLAYQYARALERAGRLQDAARLYGWAVEGGHAPAAAARQRLASLAAAPAPAEPAQVEDLLAGTAALLRRYGASLPAAPSDPLAVLTDLDGDPTELLRWVAAETRPVAYRGTLRGARGVLLDRAGNSLDRALLLTALLRQAGWETRLARAQLSPAQAAALLPGLQRSVAVPAAPPGRQPVLELLRADPRFDPAIVAEIETKSAAEAERLRVGYAQRMALLLPALQAATADLAPAADAAAEAAALEALADHVWVQVRGAQGWQDLDPEAQVLGPLGAAEILDPAALPEALRHAVVLRVVLELQSAAGLREERLLEWQGHPPELLEQAVVLVHLPRRMGTVEQSFGAADYPARLVAALDGETAWVPMLQIGRELVSDRLFTRDGEVAAADLAPLAGAGSGIAGLSGSLDAAFGGPEEAAAPAEPAIPTAEWLEIEIHAPGAAPIVLRRTVFDLLGPAARRAGTPLAPTQDQLRDRAVHLLGRTEVLIGGAAPTPLLLARLASQDLAGLVDSLRRLAAATDAAELAAVPPAPPLPYALLRFASQRFSRNSTTALASPNVVLHHLRYAWNPDGTITEGLELDIVGNQVTAGGDWFQRRLAQGVADTVLEGLLSFAADAAQNAARFHAEDLAAGKAWTPLDAARLAAAPLPPDLAARLAADLEAGYLVIAPADLPAAAAADRLAWWRIDPASGKALGMLKTGGGATLFEAVYKYVNIASCAMSGYGLVSAIINKRIADAVVGTLTTGICVFGMGLGAMNNRVGVPNPDTKYVGYVLDALGMIIDAGSNLIPS